MSRHMVDFRKGKYYDILVCEGKDLQKWLPLIKLSPTSWTVVLA